MVLLRNFVNIFFIPELRKKLFFTIGIVLVVHRLGNYLPVIGVDIDKLKQLMDQPTTLGGIFAYFDLFSGGNLQQCSIFALGIQPYISASIMMQILTLSIPSLEMLSKEGEYGRKVINQYTRYLSLLVSIIQGTGFAFVIERYGLVLDPGWSFRIVFVLSLMVGSFFVMWLSEQISLFGVGEGSSMIIFSGIVSRFPADLIKMITAVYEGYIDFFVAVLLLFLVIAIISCIVFLEKGERKIPVQYSRRVVGNKMYAAQSTYIPFKINTVGVMPVIFASVVIGMPLSLASFLSGYFPSLKIVVDMLVQGTVLHSVLTFLLIIFFSFVYTALVFNPDELADNMKKSGGFVPGLRPGKQTAEFFNFILTRIGLSGAVYLAFLALLPTIAKALLNVPLYLTGLLSGTSLLIVVGVAIDTAAQVESYLIEYRYEGFLKTGRFKRRALRQ